MNCAESQSFFFPIPCDVEKKTSDQWRQSKSIGLTVICSNIDQLNVGLKQLL